MNLPRVLCIVGPTSSGKTALSLRLARTFGGEIVNADARQLYTGLTIGTGKPVGTWENRGAGTGRPESAYIVDGIPHHLMDILEPNETLTVAEWCEQALRKIHEVVGRGHLPIIVGGTGLFIRALVEGLDFPKVAPQPSLRAELEKKSLVELVESLVRLDPQAAEKIDLKNFRRVIRALEVCLLTGRPFIEQQRKRASVIDAFQVGIQHSREELYRRIDAEVDSMIERGWIDEVRGLLDRGISLDAPAMTSIGYRELAACIEGTVSREQAVELCKQGIRHYAKRQETWFKKDPTIHWVQNDEEGMALAEKWLSSS